LKPQSGYDIFDSALIRQACPPTLAQAITEPLTIPNTDIKTAPLQPKQKPLAMIQCVTGEIFIMKEKFL